MEIIRLKDDVYIKIQTKHDHVSPIPVLIEQAVSDPPSSCCMLPLRLNFWCLKYV